MWDDNGCAYPAKLVHNSVFSNNSLTREYHITCLINWLELQVDAQVY